MKFWKMHGAGNDFILIDDREGSLADESLGLLAKTLCTRRLSIGADGLMIIRRPEQDGDLRMLFYNSDGSIGEMCGNGARCICRYAYENGFTEGRQTVAVETTAGLVTGERLSERIYRIRLNDPTLIEPDHPLDTENGVCPASYILLGDPGIPHVCVPYPDLASADEDALRLLGRTLRFHPSLPKGANVNFYEELPDGTVYLRTYERGVEDFTHACGTGTGSVAVTLANAEPNGTIERDFSMTGGRLSVRIRKENGRIREVLLTGPTSIVAIGEVMDEDLP